MARSETSPVTTMVAGPGRPEDKRRTVQDDLTGEPEQPAWTSIVSKQQLKHWLEHFRLHGLPVDHIVAEYFLLPQHPNGAKTVSLTPDNQLCIREDQYSGYVMEPEIFQMWWQGLENPESESIACTHLELAKKLMSAGGKDISHWDIGNQFPQWLTNSEVHQGVERYSLLTGEFLPAHKKRNLSGVKWAAMIAAIAFIGYWGYSFYEYRELRKDLRHTERSIVTLFLKSFPGEPYLDRPRKQVESLINRAVSGSSAKTDFQFFMDAVRQVTPQLGATVDEIGFRDESMVVLCTVNDLSTLDRVRQAFDGLDGVTAELMSSGARDNKISGRFRLRKS